MPEIPEIRAHAERLETLAAGEVLKRVEPLSFTALKTASPSPDDAVGWPLRSVGQRAKFLLLRFAPPASDPAADGLTFVVHLMQGGRLRVLEPGAKRPRRPRDGLARFEFESGVGLMLTEPGTQKRGGVWVLAGDPTADGLVAGRAPESADTASIAAANPLAGLGPEATDIDAAAMAELMAAHPSRLHNFLRDQRAISGLGRRLANEICHRAKLSPFAPTGRMDSDGVEAVVAAIGAVVDESLAAERQLPQMSRSAERPSAVHSRTGEQCPVCGDVVRAVEYRDYSVNYCAGCQTSGRILADNTTSKFLR
ncbi:DNA-formamidopyrimidine glycosylase family protein [Candidatus Poriferisodalis multihospitum]|uniref:DNA-formamidopyrimidine glycosylase family protein n=1 Tax=Candidatus Poriferisodalis multihospitum TaxID=2983191 RepID=UPI002B25C65C|nr:DNA-formamidopyrimidine glycosylase family protein [Candidatus Poriferisodalis multihospitum]